MTVMLSTKKSVVPDSCVGIIILTQLKSTPEVNESVPLGYESLEKLPCVRSDDPTSIVSLYAVNKTTLGTLLMAPS